MSTFTSRITDANGGAVGNQLHAAKQQMERIPPRDSLAVAMERTRRIELAHSRHPANAVVLVRPGDNINTALNTLKKRLSEAGVWTLIAKRKSSPLHNAMTRRQRRRRKDTLAHKRRMKNISRARRPDTEAR